MRLSEKVNDVTLSLDTDEEGDSVDQRILIIFSHRGLCCLMLTYGRIFVCELP